MKLIKLAGALLVLMSGFASASNVVDINSKLESADSSMQITLNAGTYIAQAINGTYTAWNAWGDEADGCNVAGTACIEGWMNSFNMITDAGEVQVGSNSLRFATAALALSNASPFQFTLANTQEVTFYAFDSGGRNDNFGGVSVLISPVPEASTIALLSAGLGIVGFMVRRKNRK